MTYMIQLYIQLCPHQTFMFQKHLFFSLICSFFQKNFTCKHSYFFHIFFFLIFFFNLYLLRKQTKYFVFSTLRMLHHFSKIMFVLQFRYISNNKHGFNFSLYKIKNKNYKKLFVLKKICLLLIIKNSKQIERFLNKKIFKKYSKKNLKNYFGTDKTCLLRFS